MAKRETVAQAHARGYDEGFLAGSRATEVALRKQFEVRKAQLEALEAVTRLVSHAGQAIGALANVYDNGPRN